MRAVRVRAVVGHLPKDAKTERRFLLRMHKLMCSHPGEPKGGVPKGTMSLGSCTVGVRSAQHHPTRSIGSFFVDLPYAKKLEAVALRRIAGTLPRVELVRRIEELRRHA